MKALIKTICFMLILSGVWANEHSAFLSTLPDAIHYQMQEDTEITEPEKLSSINLLLAYEVLDYERFEKNVNDEWQYTNDEAMIGLAVNQYIGNSFTATLKTQALLNFNENIFAGMRFDLEIHNPFLSINYSLRHYFENRVTAEYALGQAAIHTLGLKVNAPVWKW